VAGVNLADAPASPNARGQLGAIATVRWRIFVNSLRTIRGRMELVSRIFLGLLFSALGLGGAIGLGVGAFLILSRGRTGWLAVLLWPVFLFWLLFPLLATAFAETFDSSNLLRYPLNYPTFFLINLIYGSLEANTVVGILWLTGIGIGAAIGVPWLAPWSLLVLAMFGTVNILLVRVVFAWIERWLARRRTREIMGILFFLVIISFQMIGPIMARTAGKHFELPAVVSQLLVVQRFLPAGLAAEAIGRAFHAQWGFAAGAALLLSGYGFVLLLMLHLRLRAQYAGENLGEGVARDKLPVEKAVARSGWALPGFSGPVAAVMEKEVRYLARSGPMLFTLIMPAVVLLLFRMGANPGRRGGFGSNPDLAFPIGAAYALLMLTNLIYNSFGADGAGVQFFFVAPVRMREVLLAKNLVHAGVLVLELCLVWIATSLLYHLPNAVAVVTTLAAVSFAAPLNFCAGNLLSLYTPKKYDYGAFGRQRAAGTTVLASFAVQAAIAGVAALGVLTAHYWGSLWIATAIFAPLAAAAFAVYWLALQRVDRIALDRREPLISELSRAS